MKTKQTLEFVLVQILALVFFLYYYFVIKNGIQGRDKKAAPQAWGEMFLIHPFYYYKNIFIGIHKCKWKNRTLSHIFPYSCTSFNAREGSKI